jgi:putative peptidoglycan lipid II flippase
MGARVTRAGSTHGRLARGVVVLTLLQGLEQSTGLVSQMLVAGLFGASATTDAWIVGSTVVALVTLWVTAALQQVLIPMFRRDLAKHGETEAWRVTSILLNDLTVLFVGVVAAAWLAAPLLVRAIAVGFDAESTAQAVTATRIAIVGVPLVGVATFLAQILFSYQRYFLAGLGPIAANVAFAATLVILSGGSGVVALGAALVAGNAAQLLVASPALWRQRRLYRREIDFRHPRFRELARLTMPLFVTTGGDQIERIVDRAFASLLAAGSLSSLAFARVLSSAPNAFLLHPLQRTVFPHFTKLAAEGDHTTLGRQLVHYVRLLVFLTVPLAVGLVLLSDSVVSFVYQRGAFDGDAVERTGEALAFFVLGLPASFVGKALNNTHLALQDTTTTMVASLSQIGAKIALAVVLIPFMAHAGIALAESLSQVVRVAVLTIRLPAALRPAAEIGPMIRSALVTLAIAGVMGLAVLWLRGSPSGPLEAAVQCAALAAVGATIFFSLSALSRQDELRWLGRSLAAIRAR